MIIEDIKNSIRDALHAMDENLIFHFEEIKHTGFPYALLNVKRFTVEATSIYNRKKCDFSLELVYMKSGENKFLELYEAQEAISQAILPAITVKDKQITLDNVEFSISELKLVMEFDLSFYTYEEDENETMQTLDITYKGE